MVLSGCLTMCSYLFIYQPILSMVLYGEGFFNILYLSIYISTNLSIYGFVWRVGDVLYLYIYLSIYISFYGFVWRIDDVLYLSIYLWFCLAGRQCRYSIYISIYLPTYLSIYGFVWVREVRSTMYSICIYISIYLPTYLWFCMSGRQCILSIYLSIYLWFYMSGRQCTLSSL